MRLLVDNFPFLASRFARGNWWKINHFSFSLRSRQLVDKSLLLSLLFFGGGVSGPINPQRLIFSSFLPILDFFYLGWTIGHNEVRKFFNISFVLFDAIYLQRYILFLFWTNSGFLVRGGWSGKRGPKIFNTFSFNSIQFQQRNFPNLASKLPYYSWLSIRESSSNLCSLGLVGTQIPSKFQVPGRHREIRPSPKRPKEISPGPSPKPGTGVPGQQSHGIPVPSPILGSNSVEILSCMFSLNKYQWCNIPNVCFLKIRVGKPRILPSSLHSHIPLGCIWFHLSSLISTSYLKNFTPVFTFPYRSIYIRRYIERPRVNLSYVFTVPLT